MKSRCCDAPMRTLTDGCVKIVKQCPHCGHIYTQPKRRRAGYTDDQCSWLIPCADHPKEVQTKYVIDIDDEVTLEVERTYGPISITLVNDGLYASISISDAQRELLVRALQAL